jgi:hypothetical protein
LSATHHLVHHAKEGTMITRLTTLFLLGALAAPGLAAAKPGDRDFQHTFPVASRLCQRVADGNAPHRLAGSEDQVTAACGTLQSAYDASVAAAPGRDALEQAITDAKASVQAACQGEDRSGCRAALQAARASVQSARQSYREGARGYHDAIHEARKAFWTSLEGLVAPTV